MIIMAYIKKNPKGNNCFSDITAILNGIHQETGLITFTGQLGALSTMAIVLSS